MGILAHLAGGMGEPVVTQALAYLLNKHAGLLQAFVALLGPAGIQFGLRHRVESETGGDGRRPDMSIFDAVGNFRILVENKFWAGLTKTQPVGYLRGLPEDMPSGLLFIVPRRRVGMVWDNLQAWCREAEINLGQVQGGRVKWTIAGDPRRLLITDWQNVLDVLEGAADGAEVRCDIAQFRGLVERLDAEAFLPLRSDEVTNAEVPRRVLDYIELIDPICNQLHAIRIIDRQANRRGYNDGRVSRALVLCGRDNDDREWWVYVDYSPSLWRDSGGLTPLWLWVNLTFHLPADFDRNGVRDHPAGYLCIPIRLQLGVEQERVIENAVEQILYLLGGP